MIALDSITLRFGIGCFETLKVYADGQIAFLDEHLERLVFGANICELQIDNKNILKKQVLNFVKNNCISKKENILRLLISPESGFLCFIEIYENKNENLKLQISSNWFKQSNNILNSFKSFNYLTNYLAHKQANKHGFDDCLLLNEKEEITETTRANLFFLNKENIWLTPPLESGCLGGIIRNKLINYLKAEQKTLYLKDLKNIKTIIATNSLIEAKPIIQINEQHFDNNIDLKPLKTFLKEFK